MLAYRHTQRSCCSSRIMPLSSTVLMRYLLYVAQSLDLNKVKRTDKFLIHLELKTHPIFLLVLRVLFDAFFFYFFILFYYWDTHPLNLLLLLPLIFLDLQFHLSGFNQPLSAHFVCKPISIIHLLQYSRTTKF
jgi:hypothetical protein